MLYHPNSGYYRQFLSVTAKQRMKHVQNIVQTQAAKSMPSVNPGSVGVWSMILVAPAQ